MKKLFFIVLFLLMTYSSVSNAENESFIYSKPRFSMETIELAYRASALKDKYYLEYKDGTDLLDTCDKIVKHCKNDLTFDKYDVISIAIKESKLNHKAYNKRERVKGLMQITKPRIYWKKELFWYDNPECKDQNIVAGLVVLNTFYKGYKTKKLAIKHYNGSGKQAALYSDSIMAIKRDIISIKV